MRAIDPPIGPADGVSSEATTEPGAPVRASVPVSQWSTHTETYPQAMPGRPAEITVDDVRGFGTPRPSPNRAQASQTVKISWWRRLLLG